MIDSIVTHVHTHSVTASWRTNWDVVAIGANVQGAKLTGYGEFSDSLDRPTATRMLSHYADQLIGSGLDTGLAMLADAADQIVASNGQEAARWLPLTVIGGLEAALCDLAAQRDGASLCQWLGSADSASPLQVYANINRAARERTPETFARITRAAVAEGFRAIKIAPFDFITERPDRARYGVKLASAAREAIGPDVELMIDCHRHLTLTEMLSIAPDLAALDLRWLEDACPVTDIDSWRRIRAEVGVPMAGGEQVATPDELRPVLEAGVLDVVLPDVKHSGGVRRARALAEFCAGFGVEVSLHNPCGPVATAASLHVQQAVAGSRILEYAYGELDGRANVIDPPERVRRGVLHPASRGRGLGVRFRS